MQFVSGQRNNTVLHFVCSLENGDRISLCGCGGTVGAILTCPLEVVKTRLQSSSVTLYISEVHLNTVNGASVNRVTRVSPGPLHCLKMILQKEGPRSLFRGLGPNLVGVAPSRFYCDHNDQSHLASKDTITA